MEGLAEIARRLEVTGPLLALVLVLGRVGPLVTLLPFFGGRSLSPAIRLALALAVAVAIFPVAAPASFEPPATGMLLLLLLKEGVVGMCLGLLGAVAFHTLAMAGRLVDRSGGAPFGATPDPATGEPRSPLASLHLQLGVALFLVMGGHRVFLAAVAGSYDVVPLLELPLSPAGTREAALLLARLVGAAIAAALMLAAPAISAILLTDLALGLLGRAAPQVGTTFLALPLRSAVGLAMVLLSLSLVFREVAAYLLDAVELLRQAAGLLGA